MNNLLLIAFILISCFTGCTKHDYYSSFNDNPDLVISAGYMCGWGSGEDSLIITSTMIRYVYSVPARSSTPEIEKSRPTTAAEWNSIINALDFSRFVNLNYNSCNICVDGCDEWISVNNGSATHQIRFGLGLKIDSIKELQGKLSELRSEFRN